MAQSDLNHNGGAKQIFLFSVLALLKYFAAVIIYVSYMFAVHYFCARCLYAPDNHIIIPLYW